MNFDREEYLNKGIVITSQEDAKKIQTGETIEVDFKSMSVEFLKRVLREYYPYVHRFFTNQTDTFRITYIINGDTGSGIGYHKREIVRGLDVLIESGKLELNDIEKSRYEELKSIVSFDNFIRENKNYRYRFEIDGINYSIATEDLLYLAKISDEEFDELCMNNDAVYRGIPIRHLAYSFVKFYRMYELDKNYILSEQIKWRYHQISVFQPIDIFALNKLTRTKDVKFKYANLNNDLKSKILDGIDEYENLLEKAIFIYIKMCRIFSYDEEFYVQNQKGKPAERHKNINYISKLSHDNKKIVCYEFNLIYSKLLDELGLHFESNYIGMIGETYGMGHANLQFRCGKFIVGADSVTTILEGDIASAKVNEPLKGLRCFNPCKRTQEEFKECVTSVYKRIAQSDEVNKFESFEEIIEEYSKTTRNIKNLSVQERLSIDSLSYLLQLRKILFTDRQQSNNIRIIIIRNVVDCKEDKVTATAIIATNEHSFDYEVYTKYFIYEPNQQLKIIGRQTLQQLFDKGIYAYVEKGDSRVPGISEGEKKI